MFEKRKKEIAAKRAALRAELTGDNPITEERMKEIEAELDRLDTEEAAVTRQQTAAERANRGGQIGGHGDRGDGDGPTPGPVNPVTGRGGVSGEYTDPRQGVDARAARLADLQGITPDAVEERAAAFQRGGTMQITSSALRRSLTLTSGNIAQPSRVSGITPGQNLTSGIVDMVHVVDADGMGSDSVAYEVSGGQTAKSKKDNGTAPSESTPDFRIATIAPVLVSTLSYISVNIQRTTPLNYQDRVSANALAALRRETARQIVTGNGNTAAASPEITGILKAAAIKDGEDLNLTSIDATTLRKIALSYGGPANVEGGGVLLLNKKDLIAFGDIRGEKEKKAVYEITFSENSSTTGTIKDGGLSVRFCIVDDLPAVSDATTEADAYCMAYGKPLAYQLDLFGPYTVKVSEGYKFGEGLLTIKGDAMIGGNVIAEGGFIRVKKTVAA